MKKARNQILKPTPVPGISPADAGKADAEKHGDASDIVDSQFKPKARWKKLEDILNGEYESWPNNLKPTFIANLSNYCEDLRNIKEQTEPSPKLGQCE